MRSSVIGLGNMGPIHSRIIQEQGNTLVAVCDTDIRKKSLFPDIPFYSDYIKMLDEVKPDVVHVCTPHFLHAQMILDCLERNINVLCEKPLCINIDDVDKIIEAENKSNAIVGVCHQNRYNPENIYTRDWLKGKTILAGHATVAWNRDAAYYNSGLWRGKWKTEGGGVLINQALHTLDLMQWMIGMPSEIQGDIRNYKHSDIIEVEDSATLYFTGDSNFTFFATTCAGSDMPVIISIVTNEGEINVFPGYVIVNGKQRTFDVSDEIYGKACYGSGHSRLISDFYSCISENKKFQLSSKEASKVVKMILSSYNSNGEKIIIK